MKKQQSWFKEHPIWKWIIIILKIIMIIIVASVVVNFLLDFIENSGEKDCGEETFYIDSSIECAIACDIKCDDEGFSPDESIGLFEYLYDYEDNPDLRRCTCECRGCGE